MGQLLLLLPVLPMLPVTKRQQLVEVPQGELEVRRDEAAKPPDLSKILIQQEDGVVGAGNLHPSGEEGKLLQRKREREKKTMAFEDVETVKKEQLTWSRPSPLDGSRMTVCEPL